MRILYHHRTQADDGQAVHIRSLVRAFEEAGHSVHEVGLVRHGREESAPASVAKDRSRWGWVTRTPRFVRELAEYGYNALARQKLLREAGRFEPDFLYERYAFGNAAGIQAARRLQRPLVLEVNSPMVLELERTRGLSFPKLAERLERHIFTSADRVCVVTAVLGDMLADMGVERERLVVTPNGVDLGAYGYPDRAEARRSARADLGLPSDEAPGELVLGFVGYYRPWHRLDVVLAVLAEAELADARLVLIGEGPAREELERQAERLGVGARVHFAGKRPHGRIPSLLPAFDVALVPAINPYASPLKLHEYMAASLPIIAPDQPNLREVLTPDTDALLVPPGEPEAMAQALLNLAADAERRGRLGRAARATVEREDLTWAGNVRRVLDALEPRAFDERFVAGKKP